MNRVLVTLVILFSIYNLLSITIADIIIEGNESFKTRELLDAIDIAKGDSLDYQEVLSAQKDIERLYLSKKIYYVKVHAPVVEPISNKEVDIRILIEESNLNTISSIDFKGNYAVKSSILSDMLQYKDFSVEEIPEIKQLVLDEYLERGYFFAVVNLDGLRETSEGMSIIIKIDENRPFKHEYTQFLGNNITKSTTIEKIAKISANDVITPSKLNTYQNRLLKKAYISNCSIYPVNYNTLMIDVEESNMTRIAGIAGYNSNNEDYPLTGYVDFSFLNLFGTDREINFKWNQLQEEKSQIEFAYHDSGLLEYNFSADISLNRIEYDTLANQTDINFALNYDYFNNQFGVIYGYSSYDVTSSSLEEGSETINSFGGFWNYQNVNDIYNPSKGQEVKIQLSYNNSSEDKAGYNSTSVEYGRFIPLRTRFSLYNRSEGKYSTKKELNHYNEYKLGGFSSLRGFQSEQFSGYFTLLNRTEIRYIFGQKNNLFVFGDCAYLEYNRNDVDIKKGNLFSVGVGMRLATRLGMLTFEYGLGYNEEWTSISEGLIHFGLETSF
jgi:outer membrane protein assembly factor BamA